MSTAMEKVLVTSLDEAKRFVTDCFVAVGACSPHAETVAENLIEADYRGHFSHGMSRINFYINDIEKKILDPNAVPEIEKETVATALVNGKNSLGAVVGKYCMDVAINKAKVVGIGFVTTYNSNHYGIAGMYVLQAMKHGCIGMSVTNTSPVVVPTRAKEAALGTNPISFGVPGKDNDCLVLDMATSTVALGKLEVQKRKGQSIPPGWAANQQGEIETDTEKAIEARRLLPLGGDELTGGYKGYGLAMMVEVLSGILSGSYYGPNIQKWNSQSSREKANLGQAFIAIDPTVFAPDYQDRLTGLISHIRHMEPKDPEKPVLIPGDPEKHHMEYVDSLGGICYSQDQHDNNNALAAALKVAPMKFEMKILPTNKV